MKNTLDRRQANATAIEAAFHSNWLSHIKKTLKGRCTFISHVTRNSDHFLKIILKNKNGGKDVVMYKLESTPEKITGKDYQSLLDSLKSGAYEKDGSTDPL